MSKNWKKRDGVVYSTNPDFEYSTDEIEKPKTLETQKKNLKE